MTERSEFERAWPWLAASLAKFPTHNEQQTWDLIRTGRAKLWTNDGGVIVTQGFTYPIGFRCCNYFLQGGELEPLKALHGPIERWARENHCDWLTGWGRDGWARVQGWEACGTRRRKVLT
jgi:hypothetical protein